MTTTVQFPPERVRFSSLKRLLTSPAHYRAGIVEPRDPSAAMQFGTLVHALVLGGGRVRVYDGERRGNAWKDWKAENASPDGTPNEDANLLVTSKERDRATRVAEAIAAKSCAAEKLGGEMERQLKWRWHGRDCQGRLDVLGARWVCDVKVGHTAQPARFLHLSHRMLYHAQLAWYRIGMRENGIDCDSAYVLACETYPPFAVTSFRLTERALEEGEKTCLFLMERLAVCEADDHWPDYAQNDVDLDVPEAEPELVYGEEPEVEAA